MKSRIIWIAVVIAAIAVFYFVTIRPAMTPVSPKLNRRMMNEIRPPEIAPPELPAPVVEMPTIPLPSPGSILPDTTFRDNRQPMQMEVPIQNRATIDFSIGAPVVRSNPDDVEALDKALKEMAEATKDTKFPPATGSDGTEK